MSTLYRNPVGVNQDQTGRVITFDNRQLAYVATLTLTMSKQLTSIQVAQLTGALTINAGVGTSTTGPFVGDKLEFLFTADGTNRVVTFGTGFVSTGTATVTASKGAYVSFIFNGAAWQEMARAIYA